MSLSSDPSIDKEQSSLETNNNHPIRIISYAGGDGNEFIILQ